MKPYNTSILAKRLRIIPKCLNVFRTSPVYLKMYQIQWFILHILYFQNIGTLIAIIRAGVLIVVKDVQTFSKLLEMLAKFSYFHVS